LGFDEPVQEIGSGAAAQSSFSEPTSQPDLASSSQTTGLVTFPGHNISENNETDNAPPLPWSFQEHIPNPISLLQVESQDQLSRNVNRVPLQSSWSPAFNDFHHPQFHQQLGTGGPYSSLLTAMVANSRAVSNFQMQLLSNMYLPFVRQQGQMINHIQPSLIPPTASSPDGSHAANARMLLTMYPHFFGSAGGQ
jgi:hypothetical protein